MAQKYVDLMKNKLNQQNKCNVAIQTDNNPDFTIKLAQNKFIQLYKSKAYNDYILTVNTNKSKKIVITRSMWKIFRKNIDQIDGVFMVNRK